MRRNYFSSSARKAPPPISRAACPPAAERSARSEVTSQAPGCFGTSRISQSSALSPPEPIAPAGAFPSKTSTSSCPWRPAHASASPTSSSSARFGQRERRTLRASTKTRAIRRAPSNWHGHRVQRGPKRADVARELGCALLRGGHRGGSDRDPVRQLGRGCGLLRSRDAEAGVQRERRHPAGPLDERRQRGGEVLALTGRPCER